MTLAVRTATKATCRLLYRLAAWAKGGPHAKVELEDCVPAACFTKLMTYYTTALTITYTAFRIFAAAELV